jgi:hypothetical protein
VPEAVGDFCGLASYPLLAPVGSMTLESTSRGLPSGCDVALSSYKPAEVSCRSALIVELRKSSSRFRIAIIAVQLMSTEMLEL